jgi:short-subunit dehydrogenase
MRQRRSGHIITVSSMAGKLGFPFNSAYVAAKHAAVGFTHALRAELVETGIHASVVCPGGVNTAFASVTEGGPLQELFAVAGPAIRRFAEERDLPLTPVEGVLPADDVAAKIVQCIEHPVAEVYTHRGSAEFSALAARDREEAERFQRAAVLAETLAHRQIREKDR